MCRDRGFLYVDPLAVFFAITVSLVVVLAAFGSAAYMRVEEDRGELSSFQVRLYFVFFSVFASGMLAPFLPGTSACSWVLIRGEHARERGACGSRGQGPLARGGLEVTVSSARSA